MSLILDALRKADSERERGSVPGLHAQPVPALSVEPSPPAQAMHWKWIAVGLAVGVAAALGWYSFGRNAQTQEVAAATAPPLAPPAATVAPAPAAAPPPSLAPAAVATTAPSSIDAQPIATPAPWPQPEVRKPAEQPDAKSTPPADATAAELPVLAREQLPDNVRAALPPLAVGGSIYSTNAANRSLILDGRIYRENEQLTADLALEQIKPKAAVFRFKGYRFEIQY